MERDTAEGIGGARPRLGLWGDLSIPPRVRSGVGRGARGREGGERWQEAEGSGQEQGGQKPG